MGFRVGFGVKLSNVGGSWFAAFDVGFRLCPSPIPVSHSKRNAELPS